MKFLKVLFIAFAVVLLIKLFAFTSCIIPFNGMENSLYEGERVIVNKWSYGLRSPFTCLFSYQRWFGKQVRKNDIVVFNNPLTTSHACITSKAVFISRCTGVAGDTLFLNSQLTPATFQIQNPDYKSLYSYPKEQEDLLLHILADLGIKNNLLISYHGEDFIRSFSRYELYLIRQKTEEKIPFSSFESSDEEDIFPLIVPGKGVTVPLNSQNVSLLYTTIRDHEKKSVELKEDTLF